MNEDDRSAQGAAGAAANNATGTASSYGSTAAGIGSTVIPTLTRDVNNAPGFSPTDLNAMLVGGEQGAGGANAGIVGQAGLTAARTRNSAALPGVYDQAARRTAQTLSNNALNVQTQNAQLKQKQRQAALSGLEGMYGTDVNAQLKAMGIVPEDINAETNAGNSGWLQNTVGTISALGGAKNGPLSYIG